MTIEGVGTQVDQFRYSLPSKTEEANKAEIIKRIQRRRKFLFLSHHLLSLLSFLSTVARLQPTPLSSESLYIIMNEV